MIHCLRFHGRGGEGVKLASHMVSRAAFLAGCTVQDAPLYGAERRGAPVMAFVRIGDQPIRERGYIERPDAVVVMDSSLLDQREAGARSGVEEATLVIVNSPAPADELKKHHDLAGRVVALDVSSIALDLLHHHLLAGPIAGLTVGAAQLAPWDAVAEAVRLELRHIGASEERIASNVDAARRAFDRAPPLGFAERRPEAPAVLGSRFIVPPLPARLAAPSIRAGQTSRLRSTAGWRVYRPVIDLARCTRCFFCFALCPDSAIELDRDGYPHVDYGSCKGCLVCAEECPTHAIGTVREEVA
jgi:pyruvate ferredoxin oxidoreductase gamma subunit